MRLFFKSSKPENPALQPLTVYRTKEATLWEAATAIILVALWVIAAITVKRVLQMAPPYDHPVGGQPDWNDVFAPIVLAAIGTGVAVYSLYNAYRPHSMRDSMGVAVRNMAQLAAIPRLCRIHAVSLSLLMVGLNVSMLLLADIPPIAFVLSIIPMVASAIYAVIRLQSLKNE
ncbi:MAG: hypothetical protein ACI3YX_06380 [Prevotella sp.]